jgi:hypothetical protein
MACFMAALTAERYGLSTRRGDDPRRAAAPPRRSGQSGGFERQDAKFAKIAERIED